MAKVFLEFIYSDDVAEDAVTCDLFDLAKMYDVPKLQNMCLRGLRKNINVDNCSKMLEAANKHDLEDLFSEAMDFFRENKAAVAKTEGWKDLEARPAVLAKIALYP